jgi:gluconokinase
MTPLCKIAWFRNEAPEIFSKAALFISIKEYLWFTLFGTFEIDHSLASATGLFDIRNKTWHPEAMSIAGITPDRLSIPVPSDTLRKGHSSEMWPASGLTGETIFCIGGSDGCLAMPGSGAMKKGYAAISIGTSAAVRVVHTSPMQNEEVRNFCYVLDDAHYICGCPLNNGGNVADWLMQTFLPGQTIESFFEKGENYDAVNQYPLFLPYLNGERAPVWNEDASGAFLGIRSWHKAEDLVQAGFEGICFALKQQLLVLERFSSPFVQLQASGGFTRSAGWVQLLSDITGKPIAFNSDDDASARGAALIAMKAMEWFEEYPDAAQNKKLLKPRISHTQAYEDSFTRFCAIYPSIKRIHS